LPVVRKALAEMGPSAQALEKKDVLKKSVCSSEFIRAYKIAYNLI
jgi:hypothetical protein